MLNGKILPTASNTTLLTTSLNGNSIIPISDSDYHIIPKSNGIFSTPITIRETDKKIFLTPYDIFEDEKNIDEHSIVTSIEDLIKSDSKLTKGDKIGDISFKYEISDSEKELIDEWISQSSYEKEELLGILVDILEEYPAIPCDESDSRPLLPKDLINLFHLFSSVCDIDTILDLFHNTISSNEFYQIMECDTNKKKIALFKSLIS